MFSLNDLMTIGRIPHEEYYQFDSVGGRAYCALAVVEHTVAAIASPVITIAMAIGSLVIGIFKAIQQDEESGEYFFYCGGAIIFTIFIPLLQVYKVMSAVAGIVHPGAYYRETLPTDNPPEELVEKFIQLAQIAEDSQCSNAIVSRLRDAQELLKEKLNFCEPEVKQSFYDNFQNCLDTMLKKFNEPRFSKDYIRKLLVKLEPDGGSGLAACAPGFERLMIEICNLIDMPEQDEEKYPWLMRQYKEQVLTAMVAESHHESWRPLIVSLALHDTNRVNALINMLGAEIGLSEKTIERARADSFAHTLTAAEVAQLREAYQEIYSNRDKRMSFVLERINVIPSSEGDTKENPGLPEMRQYIIVTISDYLNELLDKALNEIEKNGEVYNQETLQKYLHSRAAAAANEENDLLHDFLTDLANALPTWLSANHAEGDGYSEYVDPSTYIAKNYSVGPKVLKAEALKAFEGIKNYKE